MPRKQPAGQWEDAKLALQEVGGWIKNADAKSTILAAALGVLFVTTASRAESLVAAYRMAGCAGILLVAIVALLLAAFVGVGLSVYDALRPRSPQVAMNRFAWPALAELDEGSAISWPDDVAAEAWAQAILLSKIAKRKYAAFSRALKFFGVAVLLVGVLVIWTTLIQ